MVEFQLKYLSEQDLKEREEEILLSIEEQYKRDLHLSDAQLDLIEDIYKRY